MAALACVLDFVPFVLSRLISIAIERALATATTMRADLFGLILQLLAKLGL